MSVVPVQSRYSFNSVQHLEAYDPAIPAFAQATYIECCLGDQDPNSVRTLFDGAAAAPMSVPDYMIRLIKHGHCSKEVMLHAALLVRRLVLNARLRLTSRNVHRVLLAAFVVAAKLRDDLFYSNTYYARIGGVPVPELLRLELGMLHGVGWNLHVTAGDFATFRSSLLNWYAGQTAHDGPDCIHADSASPAEATPGPSPATVAESAEAAVPPRG
eukprot:TRINITY_DN3813_c0_g5_i1.p1 TRINITY_DN3813_c0_g5~~TRINITY_DN3813_c0_g5_i1.p1  ORF type:complete len:214 (+),score=35.47 TRINITY_DN3813_c0_g5_i1:123-764(+)